MSSAAPQSREEYQMYCLRRLGAPVLSVNLDQTQIDDCTDAALRYYWDYHMDGSAKCYYKYQLTQDDVNNRYVILPENIIGAVRIFPFDSVANATNIFDLRYQIALNDLYTLTSQSMIPYFMAMQHLELLEELLVGQKPIRFNRRQHKLHIDMDWQADGTVGQWIVVEAYEIASPESFPDVWRDRWLLEYGTNLMKKDFGEVLKRYSGVALPGNVTLNGQQIYNEAVQRLEELEAKMLLDYSVPVGMLVG